MRLSLAIRSLLAAALLCVPSLAAAQAGADFGTVTVTVRPANADVFIDGERWVSPDPTAPLVVQLAPGRHTIEARAAGRRPYSTVVDVHPGESTPVNVSLPAGPVGPPPFAQPPPPQGPMGPITQVSRTTSEDGFVFASDFRITELNHRTTGLAGFYGGMVFAGQVMIGGGAYFQLDDHYSEQMVYGGAVAEWRVLRARPIGITLHGLAGYGEANVSTYYADYPDPHGHGNNGYYYGGCGYNYRCGPYEGFFVGEPEVQVVASFGRSFRLVGGLGYRFTTADFNDLNGITGSIALQFGR